jgi:hypothetical protein
MNTKKTKKEPFFSMTLRIKNGWGVALVWCVLSTLVSVAATIYLTDRDWSFLRKEKTIIVGSGAVYTYIKKNTQLDVENDCIYIPCPSTIALKMKNNLIKNQ